MKTFNYMEMNWDILIYNHNSYIQSSYKWYDDIIIWAAGIWL